MISVRLDALRAAARPDGYYDAVVAAGTVKGGRVWLTQEAYQELKRRFRPDAPTFLRKVQNFAGSVVSHVKAGMPRASEEEVARRFAICQTCPFLVDQTCVKCGCPVIREKRFISKLSWANENCPVGHW